MPVSKTVRREFESLLPCQGVVAKWEGGGLQNRPIVGSIPTRASIPVKCTVHERSYKP